MKEQSHVMIDLETLGTAQDTIVPIIGACIFSPTTGEITDTFYAHLNQKDQQTLGRTTTPATIEWWKQQSDAAKKELLKPGRPFKDVMEEFADFLPKKCVVWGNGATFDISILENCFRMLGMNIPWAFWDVRDVRTVVDLAGKLPKEYRVEKGEFKFEGVAHNAADDARHQATYVSAMWQALIKPSFVPHGKT